MLLCNQRAGRWSHDLSPPEPRVRVDLTHASLCLQQERQHFEALSQHLETLGEDEAKLVHRVIDLTRPEDLDGEFCSDPRGRGLERWRSWTSARLRTETECPGGASRFSQNTNIYGAPQEAAEGPFSSCDTATVVYVFVWKRSNAEVKLGPSLESSDRSKQEPAFDLQKLALISRFHQRSWVLAPPPLTRPPSPLSLQGTASPRPECSGSPEAGAGTSRISRGR